MKSRKVIVTNAHRKYRIRKDPVGRYVRRVLVQEQTDNAAVSVVFVNSQHARRINRAFLGHDRPTDVISFPLEDGDLLEGEVYVNLDRARQQAKRYGVSFGNEVARLVIHGVLHLVGYRDRTAAQARRMKKEEERHLGFWFHEEQGT
jgi:rRNA maturation RNase YbeY